MTTKTVIHNFAENPTQYLPHLSVDCVIFGVENRQLKVLLSKLKNIEGLWALPGGYILKDESTENAAQQVLKQRTGLENIYLELFDVFGHENRFTKESIMQIAHAHGLVLEDDNWLCQRFVSLGYYALVDLMKVNPTEGSIDEYCAWHAIDELPLLAFDHEMIVKKAAMVLSGRFEAKLIGFKLLPPEFTMKEIQELYETVLTKKFRRDNFQRTILGLNILERLEKKYTGAPNKAPYLYRLKADVVINQ
jgi:ADP-ribose pyrophosphatase YjhB (NUDIX family)